MTSRYQGVFENRFLKNQRHYSSLRKHIQAHVDQILEDPYRDSEKCSLRSQPPSRGRCPGDGAPSGYTFLYNEKLGRQLKGKDLRGCRSVRVTRNFRILFVICEECRRVPECQFCFCEGLPDRTVVFLTVGPHGRAYAVREEPTAYTAEYQTLHATDA